MDSSTGGRRGSRVAAWMGSHLLVMLALMALLGGLVGFLVFGQVWIAVAGAVLAPVVYFDVASRSPGQGSF